MRVFTCHLEVFGARFAAQFDIIKRDPFTRLSSWAAEVWTVRAPGSDDILEYQAAHVNEMLRVLPAYTRSKVKQSLYY